MSKKKELSPELKAECDAAKALFVSRKNALGLTQARLADAADISAAAVAMYLNGTNPLNAKFAAVLSRLLDVPVEKFSKRLAKEINGLVVSQDRRAPEPAQKRPVDATKPDGNCEAIDLHHTRPGAVGDEVRIAHYDASALTGDGLSYSEYPHTLQDIRVSPQNLREMGVEFKEHSHLKVVTGWGQSMVPTIKHRDPLLVDISVREFAGDGIYMFSWQGRLYIKRLQWIGQEQFSMISDNARHPPQTIQTGDITIHARVLLVWNAHLL